ncbi:B12-binding domain-containing radical SAM protein [Clostridium sp. 'White wine YQ']|uniref:B12-binding domain-containing radical SAM protein n=1 Tax=Clostridium sp. 'White wine YQ' TaxID=3027474 RepID=UPI0023658172|nr:B12-binding domain-containing radical SAM protein [Clostridium sp. 'White wine YQ']MDD7793011.1 B12-binding domain-containing radical SAM protein [Clostridium sp. 'White wine YQ']
MLLTAINSKYIHSNLAVRYLKTFTEDLNYQGIIREFSINDKIERILEEIIKEKPDVVAFSTYIWNLEYVERLTELIKRVDRNIEILFGGPEVTYDSRLFLEEHNGNYVISGEGEKTYRDFVLFKLGEKDIKDIKGLYYKENEKVFFNGERPLMDMSEIVFPYKDNDNTIHDKIVYYEASRGCPFSCKYCLSSTIHGVRFLPADRVKKELQFFMDHKVKLVKFVDRTFNCNHNFSMDVWSFLINSDTNTRFHFEISADILTEEELKLLSTAPKGRFQFEVGVQTTDNKVLNNINRFVNFNEIKEKVEEMMKLKNIHQHLDLIAGLPEEDYETFKKSFNDVYEIRPEKVQLGFLKLLKGSLMRDESEKWGMEYSPYPPYEILRTSVLSYDEVIKLKKVEEMVDKYYNSEKFYNILNFFVNMFETPFDFYYELGMFFEEKGYFNRNIGNVEYYKVFIDFYTEKLSGDKLLELKEIIKFDYLSFNKKKWLPDFLNRTITKEEEKNVMLEYKEIYASKRYHVEKFSIDIMKYVKNNEIVQKDKYIIFNEENMEHIIEVG